MNGMKWFGAVAAVAMMSSAVGAQQMAKTVPVKTEIMTVTVDAIDKANREITVMKPDKTHEVLYVPTTMKRFDTLKVGDKITTKYYENIILQVKPMGAKDTDTASGAVTRSTVGTAGTAAHQRTITATITNIDPKVPAITFHGPNDWVYSTRVTDKDALAKVKVGDKVDITWTEALIISLEDAK